MTLIVQSLRPLSSWLPRSSFCVPDWPALGTKNRILYDAKVKATAANPVCVSLSSKSNTVKAEQKWSFPAIFIKEFTHTQEKGNQALWFPHMKSLKQSFLV